MAIIRGVPLSSYQRVYLESITKVEDMIFRSHLSLRHYILNVSRRYKPDLKFVLVRWIIVEKWSLHPIKGSTCIFITVLKSFHLDTFKFLLRLYTQSLLVDMSIDLLVMMRSWDIIWPCSTFQSHKLTAASNDSNIRKIFRN